MSHPKDASEAEGPRAGKRNGRPTPAALRRELRKLARSFADDVVALLEDHGMWDEPDPELDELGGRRIRRSPDDLQQVMEAIVADLEGRRGPVSIGEVAEALETTSRRLTHPMSLLVEEGRVTRSGERRGARYEVKRKRRAAKRRPKSVTTSTTGAEVRPKSRGKAATKKRRR